MYPIPILFLIYKNPSATKRVFDEIKKIKPSKLYIAADGPKDSSEHKECSEVRLITENIDWNCEVYRRYLDDNMGCKVAVSSAITWLFDNEERGIILEYDCLPHKSFFTFCESMLVKYENNKSIMHISGSICKMGLIGAMVRIISLRWPEFGGGRHGKVHGTCMSRILLKLKNLLKVICIKAQ